MYCINRNKKSHTIDSNSAFQNLTINTNSSNASLSQSQFSGSQSLQHNLDVLYQGNFLPTNYTGYSPTGYQMAVPPQTFWQEQSISTWSSSNITKSEQLISNTNSEQKQTSLIAAKSDIFAPNLIKKQNNNNLIDLNFFDSIENPKKNIANVRTSVLEAFDPLLYEQSNISSSVNVDQGTLFILIINN